MTLTYTQQLYNALKTARPYHTSKQRPGNAGGPITAQFYSSGTPTAGAAPTSTTAVALSNASTGAIPFTNPTSPQRAYLGEFAVNTNGGDRLSSIEIHDYLAHCGGINHTLTTLQTVTGFDLQTMGATSNLTERIGPSNYSDVQWWYTAFTVGGATSSTATINVTYNDGTTGNLTAIAGIAVGTNTANRATLLNSLVPVADTGKFIRGVNSIQLSVSTGGAGNGGFFATRMLASVSTFQTGKNYTANWGEIGLPRIYDSTCLGLMHLGAGGNQTLSRANVKIVYG